jgi:ComF family protein
METPPPDQRLYQLQRERVRAAGCEDLMALCEFRKDGPLQSVIHQLKYGEMTSLGMELGKRLGTLVGPLISAQNIGGMIPVPLHSGKKRERGYNQSEYIARGIGSVTGLVCVPAYLRRHKYTVSQTELSSEERKLNVGDAFRVPSRYVSVVSGRRFVLVDDVLTTGATVAACAEALRNAGALRPVVCVVGLAE